MSKEIQTRLKRLEDNHITPNRVTIEYSDGSVIKTDEEGVIEALGKMLFDDVPPLDVTNITSSRELSPITQLATSALMNGDNEGGIQ